MLARPSIGPFAGFWSRIRRAILQSRRHGGASVAVAVEDVPAGVATAVRRATTAGLDSTTTDTGGAVEVHATDPDAGGVTVWALAVGQR